MAKEETYIIPHFFTGRITDCCCMCGEKVNCQFSISMKEVALGDQMRLGFRIRECFGGFMEFLRKSGWEYQDDRDRLYCPACLPLAKFNRSLERKTEREKDIAIKHFEHRRCPNCNLDRDYVREQIRKAKETRDIFGKEKKK